MDRQFRADGLRHRGHLRLPGARPARPGLRPQVWPAGNAGGAAAGRRSGRRLRRRRRGLYRPGADLQFRFPGRAGHRGGQGRGDRPRRGRRPGPGRDGLPPARLGHRPPARLGLPDADHPLPGLRPGGRAQGGAAGDAAGRPGLQPPGQRPGPPSDLAARRLPDLRRAGRARDRHPGHLRRQLLVLRPLHRSARRIADRPGGGRLLDAGRPVRRRHRARGAAPALRPLRHPRPGRRPGHLAAREPFAGLFTQGMVTHETYRRQSGDWVEPGAVEIVNEGADPPRPTDRDRRERDHRRHREDVEVQAQCGRARGHFRRPTASTPPGCS